MWRLQTTLLASRDFFTNSSSSRSHSSIGWALQTIFQHVWYNNNRSPSSLTGKHTGRTKTLPFVASVQQVRNVLLMVQCKECGMWRLLYSPRKLSSIARQELVTILDDYTFTCSATLSDLELSGSIHVHVGEVCICDLQCYDPSEKLSYSMNYNLNCIHCCSEDNIV